MRRLGLALLVVIALVVLGVLMLSRSATSPPEHVSPAPSSATTPPRADRAPRTRPKADRVPPAAATVEVEDTELEPLPVELDADTGIRGRLVDRAGRALGGVEVRARIGRDGYAVLATEDGEFRRHAPWTSPMVATDGAGRFSIHGLDGRRLHRVLIDAPDGFIAPVLVERLERGTVKDLGDVVLLRPARIVGAVHDESGNPIAGALVRVGRPMPTGIVFGSRAPMVQRADRVVREESRKGAERKSSGSLVLGPGVSRTDGQGRFELHGVLPGTYPVSCRREGFQDGQVADVAVVEGSDAGPVDLVMERAFRLIVAVTDSAGSPVQGADVRLTEKPDDDAWQDFDWHPFDGKATTDPEGQASFGRIRVPRVGVRVVAAGHTVGKEVATLDLARQTRLVVTLQPGGEMRGRIVVAETGKPIRGGPHGRLFVTRSVLSDGGGAVGIGVTVKRDGTILERGLEPGPYRISIRCPGYRDVELGPRELEPGATIDWGTIELERGSPVDVLVIDRSGEAVEGARVSRAYGPELEALTDAAGRATLDGVSPGSVRLTAWHRDYASGYSAPVEVRADGERLEVTITLGPGATVTGIAYDEVGSPSASAKVSLFSYERGEVWEAKTDESGRYRFEQIPPGSYLIIFRGAREAVTARDGETLEVAVRAARRSRCLGTVLDARGEPVVGCRIVAGELQVAPDGSWAMDSRRTETETDAAGAFEVTAERLRAIEVTSPSGRRVVFGVPRAGERVTLRLPGDEGPQGSVRGWVRDASTGELVGGGEVVLSSVPSKTEVTAMSRRRQSLGPDGAFEIHAAPGSYRVEVRRAGSARENRAVTIEAGRSREVEVHLHAAASLSFVVGSDIGPGRGISVVASIEGDPTSRRQHTGPGGSPITLTNLRAGASYTVTIQVPGFQPHTGRYAAVAGEADAIEVPMSR